MALARGSLEQGLRLGEIDRHSLAQPIGLAAIERGIGVALRGERPPRRDRGGMVAPLPRFDAGPNASPRGGR